MQKLFEVRECFAMDVFGKSYGGLQIHNEQI